MFAVGKCWKKGEWIVSIYRCVGEPYKTLKVKKVEVPAQSKTVRHIRDDITQFTDKTAKEKKKQILKSDDKL